MLKMFEILVLLNYLIGGTIKKTFESNLNQVWVKSESKFYQVYVILGFLLEELSDPWANLALPAFCPRSPPGSFALRSGEKNKSLKILKIGYWFDNTLQHTKYEENKWKLLCFIIWHKKKITRVDFKFWALMAELANSILIKMSNRMSPLSSCMTETTVLCNFLIGLRGKLWITNTYRKYHS